MTTAKELLKELHTALRPSYELSPEGREYLRRMEGAIASPTDAQPAVGEAVAWRVWDEKLASWVYYDTRPRYVAEPLCHPPQAERAVAVAQAGGAVEEAMRLADRCAITPEAAWMREELRAHLTRMAAIPEAKEKP